MKSRKYPLGLLLLLAVLTCTTNLFSQSSTLKTPEAYFGFQPGSDGNLFNYDPLISYLQLLDKGSDRLKLEKIGTSPMGKPMYIAIISSPDNIDRLAEYKKVNRKLALDPNIPEQERSEIFEKGKVFVLATLSMHSTEVAPSQAAPIIAYDLVTTEDPEKLQWLEDVVYMMVPNHNPDGMDKVVDNYKKYKGTKYDGASLPDVYHKYVGHDNNRDFVILSQEDTKAIAAIYNLNWFPQVMVEKHQMGSSGVRYFVPPNHDPIAENIPAGIFAWSGVFGQHMATDMTTDGLAGVAQHYLFDDYWPGSTETCIWKNVIGFLTEAASVRTASPVYIEPNELRVGGKGLSEYKKSVNMLLPWEGGWWRLSDIVEYELSSNWSILKTASRFRKEILEYRNDVCREMVELGSTEPPFYYIMPLDQHDKGELVNLVALLREHGVSIQQLNKNLEVENRTYRAGDLVVSLAQPFRAFVKEVMEKQTFPERHYTPGGELIKPYDITTWSLPLHRNIEAIEVKTRSPRLEAAVAPLAADFNLSTKLDASAQTVILPVESNESYRMVFELLEQGVEVARVAKINGENPNKVSVGSFYIGLKATESDRIEKLLADFPIPVLYPDPNTDYLLTRVEVPRIALVETYFHDMDAGWTRFVFDQYHIPFTKVRPHELKEKKLSKEFDLIIFPDVSKDLLMEGKYKSGESYYQGNYHPDYTKGMGKEGLKVLMEFVDQGGKVISWGRSAKLFEGTQTIYEKEKKEEFQFPFRDISSDLSKKGLYIPGSLIRINLKPDHPITYGMPPQTGVFSRGRPVFATRQPGFDIDRRVIATYPEQEILMSGYAAKEELIEKQAALIWMQKGKGEVILFGFNPQFRASTQATFKLLFNAIIHEEG